MKPDIAKVVIEQLSRDTGCELPKVGLAPGDVKAKIAQDLLQFAILHGCVITPVGYNYLIDLYHKLGHCPCKKDRPVCPCPQSVEEMKAVGHCFCTMFWKDYQVYLDERTK